MIRKQDFVHSFVLKDRHVVGKDGETMVNLENVPVPTFLAQATIAAQKSVSGLYIKKKQTLGHIMFVPVRSLHFIRSS